MSRSPNENPYWHEFKKPLAFDCDAIESMCLEAFEIALATRGVEAFWNDDLQEFGEDPAWSHPLLVKRHQDAAEERLSRILLTVAASYRALDDQLREERGFQTFKAEQLAAHGGFLTIYEGEEIPETLRECCNKIIHTDDFRPVYDNGSQPRDEGIWSMIGEIELEGKMRRKPWQVAFVLFSFLEAIHETVDFLQTT
ncbi:MAG: hypothetical protein OIF40_05170 [Mangrovicoccus sp.]|nr:hypothetical protein [Mangrovicoccus sp.]